MRLSEHSHQISMPPSQTYKSCKLTCNSKKNMGDLVQMISKRRSGPKKSQAVMFCGCTHPSRTLLLLAESPNHTALGIHLFTADTPCQRDGSDTTWLGHQDLVKTRLATSQQRENGKMDLVQPVFFRKFCGKKMDFHWMNQWMNNGWEMFFWES